MRTVSAAILGGLLFAGGCRHATTTPARLRIEHTSPQLALDAPPLLLNDSVTVYFSDAVLPLSVTTDSFTLVDEAGHRVPGTVRASGNWVTFTPDPPLSPSLDDGSFRPGATYQLIVAGNPRSDAVRGRDEARLAASTAFTFRAATLAETPPGLPAPLRPLGNDVPFVLREPALPLQLPMDAPLLHLHFTQPVLPSSVRAECFEILLGLQSQQPQALQPRSVRVVASRLDDQPGCTVEIDLGAFPALAAGGGSAELREGDYVGLTLRRDRLGLVDYAGTPPLSAQSQVWNVVAGASTALAEWPSPDEEMDDDTGLSAGFELVGDLIRPRVRLEAGDGGLGVFRPRVDTQLRPGEPFDRGDGVLVKSAAERFAFQAIEIPAGVTVSVEAPGGAHLLALGDVRIAGRLVLRGAAGRVAPRGALPGPLRDLLQCMPLALVAAGDVVVDGAIDADPVVDPEMAPCLIAAADQLHLRGSLPIHALLAIDVTVPGTRRMSGSRGVSEVRPVRFTLGCAAPSLRVRGTMAWRPLPLDRDSAVLRMTDAVGTFTVQWQSTSPDPIRPSRPDLAHGRTSRWTPIAGTSPVSIVAGSFVRLELATSLVAGAALPTIGGLRLCDR